MIFWKSTDNTITHYGAQAWSAADTVSASVISPLLNKKGKLEREQAEIDSMAFRLLKAFGNASRK